MQTNLQRPRTLFSAPIRYEIPAFQREYVWKQEDQWEPLWDDVEQLAESLLGGRQPEAHFMGTVVIQQKLVPTATIERRIVVDGQQWLTTVQLLIDAIQEVLEDRGHASSAKRLKALVENQEEFRGDDPDNTFKVWPTIKDRVAFRHAMSNDLATTGYEKFLVVQAHDYFTGQTENWIDKFPEETGERDNAVDALENAVRANLEFVVIDLGEDDNPHVIFETLNARGTPLRQSDMIKNNIMHDAGIQSEDDNGLWPFNDGFWSEPVGRGVQRRRRVDLYLNHWLTLRNRAEMKAYDEFRAFERHVASRPDKETIHDIAKDMRDVGEIFRDVEEVRRKDIAKFLERRKTMNVGAVTPLLLHLLSTDIPQATVANCLKAIESFLVRRVVCGYGASSYGEFFVSLISKLAAEPASKADKILLSSLKKQDSRGTLWPKDDELRDWFVDAPLYQWLTQGRLRMVLTGIEEQLRTKQAETQRVPQSLHIEHIMPQAWAPHWPLPDKSGKAADRRQRAIHTIGNLTLVNRRLNSSLSNAGWDRKRGTLADHSTLFLNKHLVNKGPKIWDEAAIEKRAKWLHKKAVKVWPRPSPA